MEDTVVRLLVPAIGLISGLIGTYVGLQNRTLLAEVRKELATGEPPNSQDQRHVHEAVGV